MQRYLETTQSFWKKDADFLGNNAEFPKKDAEDLGNNVEVFQNNADFLRNNVEVPENITNILQNNAEVLGNITDFLEKDGKVPTNIAEVLKKDADFLRNNAEFRGNNADFLEKDVNFFSPKTPISGFGASGTSKKGHFLKNQAASGQNLALPAGFRADRPRPKVQSAGGAARKNPGKRSADRRQLGTPAPSVRNLCSSWVGLGFKLRRSGIGQDMSLRRSFGFACGRFYKYAAPPALGKIAVRLGPVLG